jgi:hypothetical protein
MGDVYSCLTLHALRCMAPGVDGESLTAIPQKSEAAAVTDAYKKVQI